MKRWVSFLTFLLMVFTLTASLVMWRYDYPQRWLCNIITPSMGRRDLPLVYPSSPGTGAINSLRIKFVHSATTGTIAGGSICTPLEPYTPTVKVIGDILSSAPSFIHGLICEGSAYNYSAFAHLITGPYTEKRAYTDMKSPLIKRILEPSTSTTGKLYITEDPAASTDITVYIGNSKVCISGEIETEPERLMPTISALIGIPYPIWGTEPDWILLGNYYSPSDILLMKIRYLELLSYRTSYMALLTGKQVNYRELVIKPYLFHMEKLESDARQSAEKAIQKLSEDEKTFLRKYENRERRRRLYSLILLVLILIPTSVAYPWELVIGLSGGLTTIAILPGLSQIGSLIATITIALILALLSIKLLKRNGAMTLSAMALTLIFPTIITIVWWGVIPILRNPSPFMSHLLSLTLPSAAVVSGLATLLFIWEIVKPSKSQETDQEPQPEP